MFRQLITAFFLLISISACASSTHSSDEHHIGAISTTQLFQQFPTFNDGFTEYVVTPKQQLLIEKLPKGIVLSVYFGTWCHDSQREVPRMLKLLEGIDNVDVNLVALDFNKTDPDGLAVNAGVKYTPTFVVTYKGKELGRIVERPVEGLIEDIDSMVTKFGI